MDSLAHLCTYLHQDNTEDSRKHRNSLQIIKISVHGDAREAL